MNVWKPVCKGVVRRYVVLSCVLGQAAGDIYVAVSQLSSSNHSIFTSTHSNDMSLQIDRLSPAGKRKFARIKSMFGALVFFLTRGNI